MTQDKLKNSILDVGFLAPHVAHYVTQNRKQHGPLFEMAEELNRVGQRIMAESGVTITEQGLEDPKLMTFLLLIRTLSSFQGAILLGERGMIVEARTLARSCFENAYMLAALQKEGAQFVKSMISDEMHRRKGTARWLLDNPARLDYVPGGVERMEKNLAGIEAEGKTIGLAFDQITRRAGIEDFYIWYKQLSWDAAHPSIQALSRYFAKEENGKATLSWGPECQQEEVGDAIGICLPAVFGALTICAQELDTKQSHAALGALWERYKATVIPERPKGEAPQPATDG